MPGLAIFFFGFWLSVIIVGLYLAFISPQHAMRPKYLSMVWPFLAFLPVFMIRSWPRFKIHLMMFFFVCPALLTTAAFIDLGRERPRSLSLDRADRVLIDNLARGILPRIIIHIPDDTPIFVAPQSTLVDRPQDWLGNLTGQSVYVSHLAYGNSIENTKTALQYIEEKYKTMVVEQGIWDIGYIIKIDPPDVQLYDVP
jgi:hypothetical protein